MSKRTTGIMAAFILGQIVQVVLAVLAKVSFMSKPILFSIAAGFLIVIAVVAGITLEADNSEKKHEQKPKTYKEYAESTTTE